MSATLNSLPIVQAVLTMPRIGLWTGTASVDTAGALSGAATLAIDGFELACYVDGDQNLGRFEARLTGGAGAMSTVLSAKAYRGVPLRLPLLDALTEAGEELSSTAAEVGLDVLLLHWVRIENQADRVIALLASEAGASWRALPDGTIWFGTESWSASTATYQILRELPEANGALLASEAGLVLPGTTVGGRNVSRVEHHIKPGSTRSTVWFE